MNVQEKAQCVEWFIETKSVTQVRRNFKRIFRRTPPSHTSIRTWYDKFKETGNVLNKKGTGRPSTSLEDVERIEEVFRRNPRSSIRSAARELNLPRSTVHNVLHKRLRMTPYKLDELHYNEQADSDSEQADSGACKESSTTNGTENNDNEIEITPDITAAHFPLKINQNLRIWKESLYIKEEPVSDSS